MRVLIVDDEILARVGLKSSIDWQKHGMKVVGEAGDGKEALRLINETFPDVVLLDIKMPIIDGIEVLRVLKKSGFACKVIILSSFNDFENVKEAMKLGAIDYLHKPCMNSEEILSVLLNIKNLIQKETELNIKKDELLYIKEIQAIKKEEFIKELLLGIKSDEELYKLSEEFGVSFKNKKFRCMLFKIKNYKQIKKRYEDEDKQNVLQTYINNIVSDILSREPETRYFQYNTNLFVVIKSYENKVSENDMFKEDTSLINIITNALNQFLNIQVVFGVSNIYTSIGKIKHAFEEGLKLLSYSFFIENKQIFYSYDLVVDYKNNRKDVDMLIEKSKQVLVNKQYAEFIKILNDINNRIINNICLLEHEIKKIFMGYLFIADKDNSWLSESEIINSSETFSSLFEHFSLIFGKRFITSNNYISRKGCNYLLREVINYINENYNKDLSMNKLCEIFNVSYSYLSKLFNKNFGKSFYTYLNEIRVEKAKVLLKDSRLKIYEVGFEVGFKSSVHFNIVFNKFLGISPKQFRESI